jgi:hypothetical protein
VSDERQDVVLGVVVAPGLAEDVTAAVVADLAEELARRHGAVSWRTELVVDRLVEPPAPTAELIDAARRLVLDRNWDLAIVVTDLPLRQGARPVRRHASPTHGVAVISLPAFGVLHLRGRLRRTLLDLVAELVGQGEQPGRLRELASEIERTGVFFVPAVVLGHLHLLVGMVRANRPWRLAVRLYGVLAAALAAGAYGVVTSDIWQISDALGWQRLVLANALSVGIIVAALIVAHDLWERAPDPRVRDQVVLFNVVTALTVVLGILTLYAALFVLILGGAELVVRPHVFRERLGHSLELRNYLTFSWFAASLATIGGALASGLESHHAVREAAYAARARDRSDEGAT